MEEGNRVEVTIIDPTMKIPSSSSARSSTKTLSTIHECDSSKVSHSCVQNTIRRSADNADKPKSNPKCFPSSKQRLDSLRGFHSPFDIDLLLRYYACNSNMEKSIKKVFEKVNENCTTYPNDSLVNLVCKDIEQGPLIELGAVRKIFDLLRSSNSESASLFAFRIQETLIELQSLIGRYNGKELEQILSSDPSMRICKYCGVISCTKSPNTSIEQRQSPPRTSYFLNAQTFANNANSGNNNSRIPGALDKFNFRKKQKMEKTENCMHNDTGSPIHKFRNVRGEPNSIHEQENQLYTDTPQKVEIMIAERENGNKCATREEQSIPNERKSERNKTRVHDIEKSSKVESHDHDDVSRTTQSSHFKEGKLKKKPSKMVSNIETVRRMKTNSNFQVKDKTKNVASIDFPSNFLRVKSHDQKKWKNMTRLVDMVPKEKDGKMLNEIQQNGDEFKEKVLNDVLYVKSKSELTDSRKKLCLDGRQGIKSKQNQLPGLINNIASITDTMTYLAHGRLEPVDTKKKEFVSQFDNGTWVQSKYSNNKHSFILHANRDYNPQLDSAFRLHEESKHQELAADDKHEVARPKSYYNYAEGWKWLKYAKNIENPTSFTCLMEDDSLENIIKIPSSIAQSGQSDTTAFSSSSAENLIHEWVKPLESKESSVQDEIREVASKSLPLNEPRASETNEKHAYGKETSVDQQRDLQSNSQYQTRCSPNDQKKIPSPVEQTDLYNPSDDSKLKNSKESIDQRKNKKNSKKADNIGRKKFTIRNLFGSLKSFKSTKSMKSSDSSIKVPTFPSNDSTDDSLKNITRRISYDESLLKTIIGDGQSDETRDALSRYQRILKNTEKMDWESFQRFVENLHSGQKHLWRDICNAINKEARRLADKDDGVTEVCIEISSVPHEGTKSEGGECSNEIVFEMDMALRDVEGFLDRQLASTEKSQLDTLERASEVIRVRNDDVCNTEVVSNQAE